MTAKPLDLPITAVSATPLLPVDQCIFLLRGRRVLLDVDLARLYGIRSIALRQAVRRNRDRFPPDFLFHITRHEMRGVDLLASGSKRPGWGGLRTRPLAFTQEGVAMLSGVLRSPVAVGVNVEIMRAFVRQRRLLLEYADLARKVGALEERTDGRFRVVFDAIRELMKRPDTPRERIGFGSDPP